jgi:hypothetical protein
MYVCKDNDTTEPNIGSQQIYKRKDDMTSYGAVVHVVLHYYQLNICPCLRNYSLSLTEKLFG